MIKYNIFENGNLILNDKNQKSYNFKKTETLFIFHGLYGRARNWQSIAKELSNNYLFTINECLIKTYSAAFLGSRMTHK